MNLPSLNMIRNKTVGQLFQASVQSKEMEKKPVQQESTIDIGRDLVLHFKIRI